MASKIEQRVIEMLSMIELPDDAGKRLEHLGTPAVTVVCEAALDSYPGLRAKVRSNAIALLGSVSHPQARETLHLLVADTNRDIAAGAIRALAGQRDRTAIKRLAQLLSRGRLDPVLVTESVKGLLAIGTREAKAAVLAYEKASVEASKPRRRSARV